MCVIRTIALFIATYTRTYMRVNAHMSENSNRRSHLKFVFRCIASLHNHAVASAVACYLSSVPNVVVVRNVCGESHTHMSQCYTRISIFLTLILFCLHLYLGVCVASFQLISTALSLAHCNSKI